MNNVAVISDCVVRVNDWSRTRRVEVRGDTVAMEIARVECSHCATCSKRMDTVTSQVHRAGLRVDWERRGGGQFIVVPLPDGKDPVSHLSEILGLLIRRC